MEAYPMQFVKHNNTVYGLGEAVYVTQVRNYIYYLWIENRGE